MEPMSSPSAMRKNRRRRAVAMETAQLVEVTPVCAAEISPQFVTAAGEGVDLSAWLALEKARWQPLLSQHGALVFRGFGHFDAQSYRSVAAAMCERLSHSNGEHKVASQDDNIYTPVDYSPASKLLWHSENSFNHIWPSKIMFCPEVVAATGGETPIVDNRLLYERLDPEIREKFMRLGVMYVRRYGKEVGLGWQKVFRTDDPQQAEQLCKTQRLDFKWQSDGSLVTYGVRPAGVPHPVTGQMCLTHQATHWHPYCLGDEVRQILLDKYGEDELPRDCFYGDGSKIEDEAMAQLCELYQALEVSFAWQKGDIMLVDNIAMAHARNAYSGERRLLVAMGDEIDYDQL